MYTINQPIGSTCSDIPIGQVSKKSKIITLTHFLQLVQIAIIPATYIKFGNDIGYWLMALCIIIVLKDL